MTDSRAPSVIPDRYAIRKPLGKVLPKTNRNRGQSRMAVRWVLSATLGCGDIAAVAAMRGGLFHESRAFFGLPQWYPFTGTVLIASRGPAHSPALERAEK